ncbi:MAG: hypothetical protein OHK0046_46270 [Anaerolineae bacterium]
MFNADFYPTPDSVIDRMLSPLVRTTSGTYSRRYLPYRQILEPSAGKGNIVDRLVAHYQVRKEHIYTIEFEPELQAALRGKEYRVIGTDFLTFTEPYAFDLIVMNPPFSNGVDHLLYAWELLAGGGDLVCLLNAETLRNPYTEKRRLLARLIDQHGTAEDIGSAFAAAERPTDVALSIVWLHKAPAQVVDFDPARFDVDARMSDATYTANPLAHASLITALVGQYEGAVTALVEAHKAHARVHFYTTAIRRQHDSDAARGLNTAINELKADFWRYVFDKTRLGQQTTSRFRENFTQFTAQTAQLAFTEANIMSVLEMFFLNRDSIMERCIADTFDAVTGWHEKNRIHTEGWKTNKSWKVARRMIVPGGIHHEPRWNGWNVNYRRTDLLNDLDRCACWLAGKDINSIVQLVKTIEERTRGLAASTRSQDCHYSDPFETEFFEVKFFKKGTVHITWRDEALLARFNQVAARAKNWVGAGY